VLGDVPPADRCRCHEERVGRGAGESTSVADSLRRLFGG
jgi:hypothetical protein